VHWSSGAFGYFPTYALGNMYAAHLMEGARRALPQLDSHIARGDVAPLLAWLKENVHRHGASAAGHVIVKEATGSAPDASAFLRHVKAKFGELYAL
jgi:carboxypeptidase Taq